MPELPERFSRFPEPDELPPEPDEPPPDSGELPPRFISIRGGLEPPESLLPPLLLLRRGIEPLDP